MVDANDVPYAAQAYSGVKDRAVLIPWLRLKRSIDNNVYPVRKSSDQITMIIYYNIIEVTQEA